MSGGAIKPTELFGVRRGLLRVRCDCENIRGSRGRRDCFPCSGLDISVYGWYTDEVKDGAGRFCEETDK
jgi:hypothetical protein